MEQITLPFKHDENYSRKYLEKAIGKSILLTITDNSYSMLSVKTKKEMVAVRLHKIFLDAGSDVLNEIAKFIKDRKRKTPLISKFIRQNSNRLKKSSYRRLNIKNQGKYHDLFDIYMSINNEYFEGKITSSITWGTKCKSPSVRKRTIGSYNKHSNIIRINPVLDTKRVPHYFIEFIVYHEMLHADIDIKEKNGRRVIHSKEFRQRERLFKHYKKAISWEKTNF